MSNVKYKKIDSHIVSDTEVSLTSHVSTTSALTDPSPETPSQIDHVMEALKGNFMPSILLLESNKIDINSPINSDTGDTLLHLAIGFSFYNVTRTLIEKFNADVNIKNQNGHTPLHILCYNQAKDLVILTYLLNNKSLNIDEEDNAGLTALSYSVINNFNIAFLCLISKGADMAHIDRYGNNIIYFALVNNNIFVVNFFYKHCAETGVSVNTTFYSNTVTLSDILITNKNIECCEHLMRNFANNIDSESIVHCCKFITEFPFYNRYNYEVINTLLYYKAKDVKGFINSMAPVLCCWLKRKRKEVSNGNQSFRQKIEYRVSTVVNTNDISSGFDANYIPTNGDMCYHYKKDNLIMFFYDLYLLNNKKVMYSIISSYFIVISAICVYCIVKDFSIWLLMMYLISQCLLMGSFCILFKHYPNSFEVNKFSYSQKESNILSVITKALEGKNIFGYPSENEICEFCLTRKTPSTHHCLKCDKCVKDYFFHSNLFNKCIHSNNICGYILYLFFVFFLHFILSLSSLTFLLTVYASIVALILLGKIISLVLCLGYGVTYLTAYNYHRVDNYMDNIQERNGKCYAIPRMNTVSTGGCVSNILCGRRK